MLCPTCETETLEEYSESADAGVIGYLCARSNSVASGSGCGKIVTVRQYRALRLKAAADAKAASDAQKIDSNGSAGSSEDDDEDDSDASDEEEDEESSEDDDAGTDSASPRPVAAGAEPADAAGARGVSPKRSPRSAPTDQPARGARERIRRSGVPFCPASGLVMIVDFSDVRSSGGANAAVTDVGTRVELRKA